MENVLAVIAPIVAVGAVYVVVPVVADTYRRFRGKKMVTCPETGAPAEIELNASHAAATSATGIPEAEVIQCSRWPERHYCAQDCVAQIR
jgi:hypothetical protein